MGYNWHRKRVLDQSLPFSYRYSHVRSCALRLARLLGVRRSDVIASVRDLTGIDIQQNEGEEQLIAALNCMNRIRFSALQQRRPDLFSVDNGQEV